MSWLDLPTRVAGVDKNKAADVNQLMEDIRLLKGGVASTAPTISLESFINNFKQYVAGNTYNTVLLDVTGTNWTITRGVFIPYQTIETSLGSDSEFRLKFNFIGAVSVAVSDFIATISGITFKNVANYNVAVGSVATGDESRGFVAPNTGNVRCIAESVQTSFAFTGDVELDSKPTWMD